MTPPPNPAGSLVNVVSLSESERMERINTIQNSANRLREAVEGLDKNKIDTKYINWTIRQIAFHLADSHVNIYLRFLWTLTEDRPTIKPFDQEKCAELEPAKTGGIEVAINLLEAIHNQWVILLKSMKDEEFQKCFYHPEPQKDVTLDEAVNYYAWHTQHHIAQIQWIRDHNTW